MSLFRKMVYTAILPIKYHRHVKGGGNSSCMTMMNLQNPEAVAHNFNDIHIFIMFTTIFCVV